MSYERADARITVRFTRSEVARIDAAVERCRAGSYYCTADRSEFIHSAVKLALAQGAGRFPPEPPPSSLSDVARAASDVPGTSDDAGAVRRAAGRGKRGGRTP